jgi:mxaJ protein
MRGAIAAGLLAAALAGAAPVGGAQALRVCADPNNLPFSNARGEGFENRLAELLAGELGMHVEYTWWAQRRGFARHTLGVGACDLIVGVPAGWDPVLATRPYYRSTYVFVWRRDRDLDVRSLDDARLRRLVIGVQLVGDNGVNTPPAHALAARGIVDNVRGYSVYGDYATPSPSAAILEAVARGDVDVAIVWGPLAGYFAERLSAPLDWAPVTPAFESPALPFTFGIAAGVRKDAAVLRDRVQDALDRRAGDVDAILDAYAVPRAATP